MVNSIASNKSSIKLVFPGEPVAQGRPRFSAAGGYVRAYDPAKSKGYKEYLRMMAEHQMQGSPPFEGALVLSVQVFRPMPKAFSKKKKEQCEQGLLRPITRPDLDNYIKGIKDALSGICWLDDAQIVAYKEPFGKFYSSRPRVEVWIKELEEQA